MTSKPEPVDAELLAAHDLALAALHEITPAHTVGRPAGYTVEDEGVVSLRFENSLAGYPGWYWTVSVARVEGEAPTVLEVELLPGDGALLAPDWVPWAVRLADYQAAQAAVAEAAEPEGEDDAFDEGDLDEGELDDDAFDDDLDDEEDEASSRLHAGDVDGVDIDELDDDAFDEDDEPSDEPSDETEAAEDEPADDDSEEDADPR
jgi:hypothetical protein